MRAHPPPQPPSDSGIGNAAASSSAGVQGSRERPDSALQRHPTAFPSFGDSPAAGPGRAITSSNDGVFANLNAKPERGEKNEDLPPVCGFVACFLFFFLG